MPDFTKPTQLLPCPQCDGGNRKIVVADQEVLCCFCSGVGMTPQIWVVPLAYYQDGISRPALCNQLLPLKVDAPRHKVVELYDQFLDTPWYPIFGTRDTLLLCGLDLCEEDFDQAEKTGYSVTTELARRSPAG